MVISPAARTPAATLKRTGIPGCWYRRNYDRWLADGGKPLRARARERVDQILAQHQPEPLLAAVQARIDGITGL